MFIICLNYLWVFSVVVLSNDDGDVNENGKKAISLDWQNNSSARASLFFVHVTGVAARLQRATA